MAQPASPAHSPFAALAMSLTAGWRSTARPEQLPPRGNWVIWLVLAGRGFGKTRTGAEWVIDQVNAGKKHIAIVGATVADVRDVMIGGPSGIMACSAFGQRPMYEPSKRHRLTWSNGAVATGFTADEPDRLRGPEHDCAWCDELAAWRYPEEAWSNLMFGLRRPNPQAIVTTTPRPIKIVRELMLREGRDVVVTRGKTRDNFANLAPSFLEQIINKYEGTRLGRQELDGEILDDVPGAMWQREWIDRDRITLSGTNTIELLKSMSRIVVGVDPAITSGEDSDETGIIVAAKGRDGRGYVWDDDSGIYLPHEWAARAIRMFNNRDADVIVAEKNQGGEMVRATLIAVNQNVPIKLVHASERKATRAEPVAMLYEQRKVHHVGSFAKLEDQMCSFTSDFDKSKAGYSPDRMDALVWAMTELFPMVQGAKIVAPLVGLVTPDTSWDNVA